jgi:hypothetical protein
LNLTITRASRRSAVGTDARRMPSVRGGLGAAASAGSASAASAVTTVAIEWVSGFMVGSESRLKARVQRDISRVGLAGIC